MRSKHIHYSLALLLSMGALGLSGCGGGDGDSARVAQTIDASKNGVTAIALASNDGSVHIKGTFQFNLIGTDSTGKETNLNNKATWTLSDKSLGSIKNGLFVAAGKMGENLTLTASYAGLSKSQALALTDANLKSLTGEHATGSVDVCKNTTFIVKALFEDGNIYDYPVTWALVDNDSRTRASFADETKAELSTKKSGLVKVIAKGVDNFDKPVTSPEMQFTIDKTLTDLTPTSNKDLNMRQGQTATVNVQADYANGSTASITANASLTSSNTGALTVNSTTGLITAISGTQSGTDVDLSASCDDTTKILKLKILKPEIKSMEIVSANSTTATESLSVSKGNSITPRIKVTYQDTSVDAEIYSANDVEWEIDETLSPDYDESNITINSATGELKIDEDLNLVQSIILTIGARIKTSTGATAIGSDGTELKDTIKITINN